MYPLSNFIIERLVTDGLEVDCCSDHSHFTRADTTLDTALPRILAGVAEAGENPPQRITKMRTKTTQFLLIVVFSPETLDRMLKGEDSRTPIQELTHGDNLSHFLSHLHIDKRNPLFNRGREGERERAEGTKKVWCW